MPLVWLPSTSGARALSLSGSRVEMPSQSCKKPSMRSVPSRLPSCTGMVFSDWASALATVTVCPLGVPL